MQYKNHEGYSDQTAGKAIRNARKKKRRNKPTHLTFVIGESPSFGEWVRRWKK